MYAYSSQQYLPFYSARDAAPQPQAEPPRPPLVSAMQPSQGAGGRSWTRGITAYLIILVAIATIGPLQFGYHLVMQPFSPRWRFLPRLYRCKLYYCLPDHAQDSRPNSNSLSHLRQN
jgi:hypothetical protein